MNILGIKNYRIIYLSLNWFPGILKAILNDNILIKCL